MDLKPGRGRMAQKRHGTQPHNQAWVIGKECQTCGWKSLEHLVTLDRGRQPHSCRK